MKKILWLLSVLCLFGCSEEQQSADAAAKDSFAVGKQSIVVPVPKDLAAVTPELGKVYEFYATLQENIVKSSSRLIKPFKHYINLADLQAQRQVVRNCYIAQNAIANEAMGDTPLTDAQFKDIVEPIKQPQYRKALEGQTGNIVKNMEKSFSQDVSRKFGTNIDIKHMKLAEGDFLVIDEQPKAFAWIVPMSIEVGAAKSDMLVSNAILNLKGKLIYAYCYATPDELPWLRDVALDWNQRLFAENQ